jgi:hypothetical protein
MSHAQMGVLYFVMGIVFLGIFVALDDMLKKPTNAQAYADRLCQELYGPQTGAIWVDGRMMCETVRGEVIEVRRSSSAKKD